MPLFDLNQGSPLCAAYDTDMRNLMTIPRFRTLKSNVLQVTLQY